MKKGFFLTMDSMLALLVAAAFITSILYFVTAPALKTDEYLYAAGGDILAVADAEGSLEAALSGDAVPLEGLVSSLPPNLCVSLTVVNSSGGSVLAQDSGCGEPSRYVMSKRAVLNGTMPYTARARVWYR
jgi:hypothetical protein